jgi:hypothetical protein
MMSLTALLSKWPLIRQIREWVDGTGLESMSDKIRLADCFRSNQHKGWNRSWRGNAGGDIGLHRRREIQSVFAAGSREFLRDRKARIHAISPTAEMNPIVTTR